MRPRLPIILLALAVSGLALAEDRDPPGRVARLSVMQGDVSFQSEDAQAPEAAEINRPLTTGDRVMTASSSRAELSVGTAAIRLDERTDISISNLDEDIAQIEVNSGAMSVHLRELSSGDTFEIDTPNTTVRLMRPGDYRVDVLNDGSSVLAVRNGDAEIDGGNGPVHVHDQQQAQLSRSDRYADVVVLGTPDDFDEWSMDRERALADSESSRYVSREVVGYEDLDRYGTWNDEPEYGAVWVPRTVSYGWAPYRFGQWVWVGPWGWTWIDDAPWGFAPFHYGRWAYAHDRWCWVPGPRHRRPLYAPALVAFPDGLHSGSGNDWRHHRPNNWIPLGPREVYVPPHRASPRYLRNINVANTEINDNTRITNSYRNRARGLQDANRNGLPTNTQPPSNGADERWRGGPGWRTGLAPGRLRAGDNDSSPESQRERLDREAALAARRSERTQPQQRESREPPRYQAPERRELRSWSGGSGDHAPPSQPNRERRSYERPMSNGGGSGSVSRSPPPRPSTPPPRAEQPRSAPAPAPRQDSGQSRGLHVDRDLIQRR